MKNRNSSRVVKNDNGQGKISPKILRLTSVFMIYVPYRGSYNDERSSPQSFRIITASTSLPFLVEDKKSFLYTENNTESRVYDLVLHQSALYESHKGLKERIMWLEKKNVQAREEMLMVKVVKIEVMEKKEEEQKEKDKERAKKRRASLRGEGPKGPSHYHLCDIEFHRSVIRRFTKWASPVRKHPIDIFHLTIIYRNPTLKSPGYENREFRTLITIKKKLKKILSSLFRMSKTGIDDLAKSYRTTADSYTRRRPQVPANKRSVDDLAHILYYGASLARLDRLLCSPPTPPTLGITITTYSLRRKGGGGVGDDIYGSIIDKQKFYQWFGGVEQDGVGLE
ncbi:hypothetical protein V1478_016296 [Vespula squamosa]|uniref:Ribosomal protein S3 n=1 Tax=Vespula squamosa TaxID=30214 RepID=A0ABD1ZZE5_VESSQ